MDVRNQEQDALVDVVVSMHARNQEGDMLVEVVVSMHCPVDGCKKPGVSGGRRGKHAPPCSVDGCEKPAASGMNGWMDGRNR
jgi:hypothetical protein